ncbi:MAG TPA: AI-2E family transporter [Candidatus Limnocylindrales bacterium]
MPKMPARAAEVAARPAPKQISLPTPRVALVIATAVVVAILLYLARDALTPFIVGLLLVYLLDPAVGWVARQRVGSRPVPRGLAVLLVYGLTVLVVVVGLRLLLGPLIGQLLNYIQDFPRLISSVETALGQLRVWYESLDLPPEVRAAIDQALANLTSGAGGIDFGALLPIARTILGTAAGFFAFLIIPIWAFYILRDRVRLTDTFAQALPQEWRDEVWAVLTIIEQVFGRWIRAQLLLGFVVGVATFVGLLVLGLLIDPRFTQFAVLLAVIAGILELLPIIGPIISAVPTLLVALTTTDPVLAVVAVVILYVVVQQTENAVLVPKIQGDAVELHPSLVIFVLIVGGAIAGLLGAILAIPITAAGRDVYRYLFRRLSDTPAQDEAGASAPHAAPGTDMSDVVDGEPESENTSGA